MGCLTGNYLLLRGDYSSADILPLMRDTFSFIAGYEGEVPGATPADCGNWLLHDLPMARYEARKYLTEVLRLIVPWFKTSYHPFQQHKPHEAEHEAPGGGLLVAVGVRLGNHLVADHI